MKTCMHLFGLALFVTSCVAVQGQGTGVGIVNFSNFGLPPEKLIYLYDGTEANSEFEIALYWGPQGNRNEARMNQIGPAVTFFSFNGAGMFNGGLRSITGLPSNGAVVALQAKAWQRAFGNSFDEALSSGQAWVGKGPIFDMDTKDPNLSFEGIPTVGNASGWQSFSIGPVPEPSTVALGLLAGAILLVVRRLHN